MREIKFRAKGRASGNWYYGYYTVLNNVPYIQEKGGHLITIDPETLGQYTNKKDKNGKEIYEDDIVKIDNFPHRLLIIWNNKQLQWDTDPKMNETISGLQYINSIYDVEIVGNKFENFKLLEGGDNSENKKGN